ARRTPGSILVPYTTLFRSSGDEEQMKKFWTQFFTWWNGQTLGTRFHTWRHGKRVGEDQAGNVYYEGGVNSDGRTRRWVIYNGYRSEEHTSELQSRENLVCR